MNPNDLPVYLTALAVLVWTGILVWVWVYFRVRRDEDADRLGEALDLELAAAFAAVRALDPAKTAGGTVGKSYTGGQGDQLYHFAPESDHHTLAEYEAIARSEQGEEIVREERLP